MRDYKKAIFLSHIITKDTPLYAGEKSIALRKGKSIAKGDSCNTMRYAFPNHTGTHVDTPLHFIKKGSSVTDIAAKNWIFHKIVQINIKDVVLGYVITAKDIKRIKNCEILLIKTGFEKYRDSDLYWRNSPALHPELAFWLIKKCPSLRAIGVDFISISNLKNRELGKEAHKSFLKNNILLIEDMKLSGLRKIPDAIVVLPLLVENSDASPCTILGTYN